MSDECGGLPTLAGAVGEVPWYHSIELPGGIVTPGEYDHRPSVGSVLLPETLTGLRCLDVGTHDGFWAFLMERRGASDVVAIDLDDPAELDWPGPPRRLDEAQIETRDRRRRAFDIAHDALGSSVERRSISVYALEPSAVGTFDHVFLGTLLHHLRDPIRALRAIRSVTTGTFSLTAVISLPRTVLHPRKPMLELLGADAPFWEIPNRAALDRQLTSAGWEIEETTRPFLQGYGAGWRPPKVDLRPRKWTKLPQRALLHFGAVHVSMRAHPA
ncbi:MAG: class I SAM-dependent methyltransferase [Acidimicrobiales bacterium]